MRISRGQRCDIDNLPDNSERINNDCEQIDKVIIYEKMKSGHTFLKMKTIFSEDYS